MPTLINDAAWSFQTANFFVGFYAEHEDLDPADSFDMQKDIDAVNNGTVEWFCAAVRVYAKCDSNEPSNWQLVGSDYLGGCAYNSVREFYTSHRDPDAMNRNCSIMRAARGNVTLCHYFPSMIAQAIDSARRMIGSFPRVRQSA